MKHNPFRLSTLIIVILLLIVLILALGGGTSPVKRASASSEQVGGSQISIHFTATDGSTGSQPWTEEELLAAQPYPLERIPAEPAVSLELDLQVGDPVFILGTPPLGSNLAIAANGDPLNTSQATPIAITETPPYIRFENFDSYSEYPYSTVGVLFFKQDSVGYRCSAASIGNNAIWTAGHCVHAGDGLHKSSEMIFIPGYNVDDNNNVLAPFGVWEDFAVITNQNWEMNGDLRFDFGGVILKKLGGKKISEVVGSLGFSANLDNNRHWFNIGYPAAFPFEGKRQHICTAPFAYNDTNLNKPYPVGIGCDMTGGSSGGPWIINFSGDAGSANYLNGHNSYRYSEGPEEMFSPYFGNAAQNLYNKLISIASP